MNYRWIGAILVFASCGGFGFSVAGQYRNEMKCLQRILVLLDNMECELSYHLTPLPDLCRCSGAFAGGSIQKVMDHLALELERQAFPDVTGCMQFALSTANRMSYAGKKLLSMLGESLGRYDLSGQLHGISMVREQCRKELNRMEQDRDQKIRSYQTLGLCAGVSLVILFI